MNGDDPKVRPRKMRAPAGKTPTLPEKGFD